MTLHTKTFSKTKPHISLMTTAAIVATAVVAFLATDGLNGETKPTANPVALKHLNDAKRLVKKGRWNDAAELYKKWATMDHPEALLGYALLISRGKVGEANLEKARELLLLAVQNQFSQRGRAAFELARLYARSAGEDCPRLAFEWHIKATQWGYSKAHIALAKYYARGFGVGRNNERSIHHYRMAAQTGSASALLAIARATSAKSETRLGGRPLKEIEEEIVISLHREARSGRASSAKLLGRLYDEGALVPQDSVIAQLWFRRAAHAGDPGAMVDYALSLLKASQGPSNRLTANEWLKRAAQIGHGGAYAHLGRLQLLEKISPKPPSICKPASRCAIQAPCMNWPNCI